MVRRGALGFPDESVIVDQVLAGIPQHRAPKLAKAEGLVDWTQPARLVARRINGLWSWPAAAAQFSSRTGKEERVLLARAAVAEESSPAGA